MGTRNVTVVIHKGEVRMAQYGQWNGYPSGVGKDIAEVLQATPIKEIRRAMGKTVFIDDKKVDKYYRDLGCEAGNWPTAEIEAAMKKAHPLLDRDYSGGIALVEILRQAKNKRRIELLDERDYESSWKYVIDLDQETISVEKDENEPFLFKIEDFTPELTEQFGIGPLEWSPEE
jgi:hypothetical protein